ncbi:MAG: molybdopterin cofactor-binding domain-containing protein [Ideonella sp.]|nr:molybdopterin cofactor-binding domain-containing protein [Ideonella sp.]
MKRRHFLAASGAGLTVLLSGCSVLGIPVIPKRPTPDAEAALGWVRFDGQRYKLWLPRAEMGQHIDTALRQIACEELGIEPALLDVDLPATTDIARVRATVGSESVQAFALPLAQACATLREAVARGDRQGTLTAEAWPASQLRAFRPKGRWVGHNLPHASQAAVVRGQALFAADVRRPGTLFGRVLRAPVSPDLASQASGLNDAAARAIPGFVALVQDERLLQGRSLGVGILARTPGALDRIEAALAVRWQVEGEHPSETTLTRAIDIDTRLARGDLTHQLRDDALDKPTDPWTVDLRLDIPAAPHNAIEPRCAVAQVRADAGLDIWAGTQDAFYVRDLLCRVTGLSESQVTVHQQRIGGGFGGRTICTVELEAALLALSPSAAGAPVKVQWTRGQELRQAFHRPPSSHRVRARVEGGRITAWWHAFVTTPILLTNAALPEWLNPVTRFTGDGGAARGAALPYDVPRQRIEYDLVRLPLYTGPWRGLGAGPNSLAMEMAIDACAQAAGLDALDFRLAHTQDPRLARVLQRVAEAAGWRQRPAAGVGRGLACGLYKSGAYVATVAEVSAVKGQWRVTRLVSAVDVGRLIHPDAVRAQSEGNLIWGLGMMFTDLLPLDAAKTAAGFAAAPVPRLPETPSIELVLVDEGDPPGGAGETAIVGAAAAIANAWHAATGRRPSRLPIPLTERVASSGS